MLQLTPEQVAALELVEREVLVGRLERHFASQWPAVADKLGPQLAAFIDHALKSAERQGLCIAVAALRYVNLCFVWGSAFDDKPAFGWARKTLADPRKHEWQKAHQLVHRSIEELGARPGGAISGEQLAAADRQLTRTFGGLGLLGRLLHRETVELPLVACDVDLAALRTHDASPAGEYEVERGKPARRVGLPASPAPVRVDAKQPAWPERLHLLARRNDDGSSTRLQLRVLPHAACDAAWHPHVSVATGYGLSEWRGEAAGAVSCAVEADEHSTAEPALGVAIAEESTPEISRLQVMTCALREEGLPIGSGTVQMWSYPTHQWLLELERPGPARIEWPGREADIAATRVRLERDGAAHASEGWSQGFESLDAQMAGAIARIGAAWERGAGLESVAVSATAGALNGRAALAWGWRPASAGYLEPPFMRVEGAFDLTAIAVRLECRGELHRGAARARLVLRAEGEAPLQLQMSRQLEQPGLDETMANTVRRFRIPFVLEVQALAVAESAVINLEAPCTGALVGEAGLSRRLEGGSGWQWYARLQVEPVKASLSVDDPVLGRSRFECTLLPDLVALAWRLG